MTFPLIVKPEAEADLEEAAAWYNRQRTGLGNEFLDAAKKSMQHIRRNPVGYAIVHGSIRAAMLRRFPYVVYFALERRTNHDTRRLPRAP